MKLSVGRCKVLFAFINLKKYTNRQKNTNILKFTLEINKS